MRGLVRQPILTICVVSGIALATAWAIARLHPHEPNFHDEFSLLLMADTFAEGRLTNPTPPCAEFLSGPHVMIGPTYASKYPVMQGLALAAGQVIGGDPFLGVGWSFALMCGVSTWMLRGWIPSRWAFIGGLLLAMHPSLLFFKSDNWVGTYWAGSLAATGSALVYGAIARLKPRPSWYVLPLMGLGALILANSRPYEGMVACLPALFITLRWFVRRVYQDGWGSTVVRVLPCVGVLMLGALAMGAYFQAVTGNPLRMPYIEHEQQYAIAPSFWLQDLRSIPEIYITSDGDYSPILRRRIQFHLGYERACHTGFQNSESRWRDLGSKAVMLGWYFALPFAVLLPGVFWLFRSRRTWLNLIVVGCVGSATFLTVWSAPRYVAPLCPCMMLLGVQSLRVWWIARPLTFLVSCIIIGLGVLVWAVLLGCYLWDDSMVASRFNWQNERAKILTTLIQTEGKHLILVRYGDGEGPHVEYVYNRADIPNAKVIWALSVDPIHDSKLIESYPHRTIWVLKINQSFPELLPGP